MTEEEAKVNFSNLVDDYSKFNNSQFYLGPD